MGFPIYAILGFLVVCVIVLTGITACAAIIRPRALRYLAISYALGGILILPYGIIELYGDYANSISTALSWFLFAGISAALWKWEKVASNSEAIED